MDGRDHGGGLDAAIAQYGGARAGWIDLSTGINPVPYPLPDFTSQDWTALPDRAAQGALTQAARGFWSVPDDAAVLAAPGASCLIARVPALAPTGRVHVPAPTYNEHAAAFAAQGWAQTQIRPDVRVIVHPNNPDGTWYGRSDVTAGLTIIDESFCDVDPARSLVDLTTRGDVVVLKSFGKFWGLAGLRLGFAIGPQAMIDRLAGLLGPWPVSGIALRVGAAALSDPKWAETTRKRLARDAARLDGVMTGKGAEVEGGTDLFRLYKVDDAAAWQAKLAKGHIWSRVFPYSDTWIRLGLPAPDQWDQLERAL